MSFNFIYNPLTNDKYSILSYEGKSLLKQFIKEYQTGGTSGSMSEDGYPKGLNDFVTVEAAKVDKLNKCETKLEECEKELETYKKAFHNVQNVGKQVHSKLVKKEQELATIYHQ